MALSPPVPLTARQSLAARARIDFRSLPTAIVAGVVGGLIVLSTSISYPAVIFTGAFEPYLGTGIEMALFGTAVLSATAAAGSSYPAAIANIQIETGVVLGVISAAIADSLGAGAPALPTLIATIVLSTLSLGVVFRISPMSTVVSGVGDCALSVMVREPVTVMTPMSSVSSTGSGAGVCAWASPGISNVEILKAPAKAPNDFRDFITSPPIVMAGTLSQIFT